MTDTKSAAENKTLVIEVTPHTGPNFRWFFKSNKFPLTIGRGFDNDLILNDPYICDHHLKISRTPKTGWRISDLNSENGFFLKSSHPAKSTITARSGDHLKVGETSLRLFSLNHAVAKSERFIKPHGLTSWFNNPIFSWFTFFAAILMFVLWQYLETWSTTINVELAGVAAVSIAIIIIWSVNWALTGKIFKHKANFTAQIAVCSVFAIFLNLYDTLDAYLSFISNDSLSTKIMATIIDVSLFAGLIFGALSFATDMTRRKRIISALLFAAGIIIGFTSFDIIKAQQFRSAPRYANTLKPYFSSLAPEKDLAVHMKNNQELFEAKLFKKKN